MTIVARISSNGCRMALALGLALAVWMGSAWQPSPAAAGKLGASDWRGGQRICVNREPASWSVGRPYRPTGQSNANCRVVDRVGADQRKRRFLVTVPDAALRRTRIPVVFFFHGTGGTGEQYWNISRWRELAAERGFVAVFPTALGNDLDTDKGDASIRTWYSFGQVCDLVHPEAVADDVGFVRAILADLETELPIDARRVYAAGFSNGGQMVHRLAAEAGDVFAAGAAWASVPAERDGREQCAADPYGPSAQPIPVWSGIGSRDRIVYGDKAELPLRPARIERRLGWTFDDAALLYSVEDTHSATLPIRRLVRVKALGGFEPVFSPVMVFDAVPTNTAGNEYDFVVLDELEHHYPNAWPGDRPRTRKSLGVTAAALQYQWFRDHPRQP